MFLKTLPRLLLDVALRHKLPLLVDRHLAGDEEDRPGVLDANALREPELVLPARGVHRLLVHLTPFFELRRRPRAARSGGRPQDRPPAVT